MRLECLSDWLLCYSSVAAIFFKTVLIALVVHLLSKYSKYRNQHLQSLTMTSRSLMSFRRLDRECKLKPHPRSGHRIVVYNNNIYAIGGYNKNFQEVSNTEATSYPLFRELWKFNIATNTWSCSDSVNDIPTSLASPCAALLGDKMLFFGGTGIPFGETASNEVHVCDLNSFRWSLLLTTGEKPTPRYGAAMTLYDSKLYVCGGTTGWVFNISLYCLDLKTREWRHLTPQNEERSLIPPSRYRHEMAAFSNKLYIFGGGTVTDVYGLEQIPAFDLETGCWELLQTFTDSSRGHPANRRCHGFVQLDSDVFVCGGYDGFEIFEDIWRFDLKTLHWTVLKAYMPAPSYFMDVTATEDGRLYVFGGVTQIDDKRTNALYEIHVRVSSLARLSWRRVCELLPNLATLSPDFLVRIGIPRDFLKEVTFTSEQTHESG